jgi:hypothetical protein
MSLIQKERTSQSYPQASVVFTQQRGWDWVSEEMGVEMPTTLVVEILVEMRVRKMRVGYYPPPLFTLIFQKGIPP